MFNKKEYHREYMKKYRENVIKKSPEKIERIRELDRERNKTRSKTPKQKEYNKKRMQKKRECPEFRKEEYKKHADYARIEKNKRTARKHLLKKKYNLTYEEYDEKVRIQDNKCAICGNELQRPVVDHCHKTGVVRAILCSVCNVGLGYFERDTAIVEKMKDYVEKWDAICDNINKMKVV